MAQDKVRVYILARELNMESKDLLDLCRQHGFDIKNQLSSLEPDQRDQIEHLVKRGGGVATAAPPKAATAVLPAAPKQIRTLDATPRRPVAPPPAPPKALAEVEPAPAPAAPPAPEPVTPPAALTEAPAPPAPPAPAKPAEVAPAAATPPEPQKPAAPPTAPAKPAAPPAAPVSPAAAAPVAPSAPKPPVSPSTPVVRETPPPAATPTPPVQPQAPTAPKVPVLPPAASLPGGVRNLDSGPRSGGDSGSRRPSPIGPRIVTRRDSGGGGSAARPKPPLGKEPPKKPAPGPAAQQKLVAFTPEMLQRMREQRGPVRMEDLKPVTPTPAGPDEPEVSEEGEGGDKNKKKPGPKTIPGRDTRQKARDQRSQERKRRQTVVPAGAVTGARPQDVINQQLDDPRRHKNRRHIKGRKQPATVKPKGKTVIEVPITVRALSEALGIKSVELLFKLKTDARAAPPTINTTIDAQTAELIALEYGQELEIKKILDTEEEALLASDKPDEPESLVYRAPVVTIMGHVDHGKTSLLDRIRKSNVVDTEAGGITQVIRAWRVEHGGRPITFLDTPGHEAFTKMRARGAHVTDVAVIVVAAEDGVMPQTEEAISHAKAAGVSLVVAINKVDLPNANINRTRQQLYGLNVLPDNMGGETPFVETSAATGKGIDELLDQLAIVAELKELKANPNRPAKGVCLEANLDPGEGVLATLLVQNGTLKRGDVLLCGASFGRVRQMYNDLGKPIQEAGPSVPVRIMGLDEVPQADDPFMVVPDLAAARTIALKRRAKKLEASHTGRRDPLTLDQLTAVKIDELKVILKADFRGSIEAIKKELDKLQHEEVRVRVLESAIGAITENDVWLSLTSPQDTLIVGFNVVPDDRARALAEERGVKILQYDIIYNLTKDIRAALEGKLKPREEVVHLGRAVVRETFKISRVGTIAGCYVTQGTIKRSGKIRLIREGVVIYPPVDKNAGLESLKRFKEDVSEVREGFECGIKIAGYDDIKVGDVIEAFRIEEVKRTL